MKEKITQKKSTILLVCTVFLSCIVGLFTYAADTGSVVRYLVGGGGATHNWGTFRGLSTNDEDGNTGIIRFGPPSDGSSGAIAVGNTLTGYLWIDTIGWAELNNPQFLSESGAGPRDPRFLSGYAWNESAGWIDFSGTILYPDTLTLSGYAWNDGIGWIPMVGAKLGQISDGIVSKVKILGNIGGSRIFNTTYSVGESFGSVTMSAFIDKVRKNIALLSRNVPSNLTNTDFSSTTIKSFEDKIIYIRTSGAQQTVRYSTIQATFSQSPIQSLIVIGADVYIDEDVIPNDTNPRAIIALADATGNQGNIYIGGNVKKIQSSLIAEGSVYSGFVPSGENIGQLYNKNVMSTMSLPGNQIYVYGTIISHNTIGGSAQDGSAYTCPYTDSNCDRNLAVRYDLNFFRGFDKQDPDIDTKRAYSTNAYDDFSMIIEYNPLIQSNPPPGLYDVKQ